MEPIFAGDVSRIPLRFRVVGMVHAGTLIMNTATRQALLRVDQILHEAGWDEAAPPDGSDIAPDALARIRDAYATLLRHDHIEILNATLRDHVRIEEAGKRMGLSAEESRQLFHEALRRLGDFVEVAKGNGAGGAKTVGLSQATPAS